MNAGKLKALALLILGAALVVPIRAQTAENPANLPQHDGSHDFDFLIGDWKAHVRRLPERPRAALAAACLVLVLGYIGLVGHAGWYVFADAWSNGDVLAGAIAWPRWPALLLVPIGCGLLALRLIVDLIGNLGAAGGALDLATHRRARAIPAELGPVSRGEIA